MTLPDSIKVKLYRLTLTKSKLVVSTLRRLAFGVRHLVQRELEADHEYRLARFLRLSRILRRSTQLRRGPVKDTRGCLAAEVEPTGVEEHLRPR